LGTEKIRLLQRIRAKERQDNICGNTHICGRTIDYEANCQRAIYRNGNCIYATVFLHRHRHTIELFSFDVHLAWCPLTKFRSANEYRAKAKSDYEPTVLAHYIASHAPA